MAKKRGPTSKLDQDNWDEEENEPSEDLVEGEFQKASSTILKQRVFKAAIRRRTTKMEDKQESSMPFANFSGFKSENTSGKSNPFSFLSNPKSNSETPKPNGQETKPDNKSTDKTETIKCYKSDQYFSELQGLNLSFTDWIKTHVEESPLCILSPIFKDYERYLAEIEEKEKSRSNVKSETVTSTTTSKSSSDVPVIKNEADTKLKSETDIKMKSGTGTKISDSSFIKPTPSVKGDDVALRPFQIPSTTASSIDTKSIFSFGGARPFSTGTFTFGKGSQDIQKPVNVGFPFASTFNIGESRPEINEEEEEDEPPAVTFTPVVEEDSIYSKKCKVFVKKGAEYQDKGVGTLYIKTAPGKDTKQLIVRADTNLGNLLINTWLLAESKPQHLKKNNVLIICLPLPDSEPPPIPVLLRVKNEEEAKELAKTLKKYT